MAKVDPWIEQTRTALDAAGYRKGGAREDAGVTAANGRLTGKALFVLDAPGADLLIVADRNGGLHLAQAAVNLMFEYYFDGRAATQEEINDIIAYTKRLAKKHAKKK